MGHPVLNHEINSQGNLENIQEAMQFDSEKGKDYKILDREWCFFEEKNENWEIFYLAIKQIYF